MSKNDRFRGFSLALAILIFGVLFALSYVVGAPEFGPDILVFMILTFVYYLNFERLRLTTPIFALLVLGLVPHALGVFGWYGLSPLPFAWDHLTHFLGSLPFAMLFFQFVRPMLDRRFLTWGNFGLILLVFLAATGVGAIVEMTEFIGFLNLGFGKGALQFGAGDSITAVADAAFTDMINVVGGGWINEGWDFVYNTLGILAGIIIMCLVNWLRPSAYQK